MARRLGEVASMTLFDAMIEGAVLIRPDSGKVVLANKAAAVMFGYISPEAMVGADPLDHMPQEDKGRIAGIMAGYFVEGNLQKHMDVKAIALDGREVWVSAVGVQIEYEGKTAGLILMKDITAQRAAEGSLVEAEERQRQILDNANESILVLQDGNVVFANRKALELGGFTEDEIRGRPFMDFLVPEDRERIMRRYLKKADSGDYASTFVVRGVGKNGSIRWSEIREASFTWEGKAAEICLVKDITEQKRAEEALEVSEKRYRLLTENVSDVIWVTDLQLKPTYFNSSVTRLLGYSVEEAMGGAMKMAPASLDAAAKAFKEAMDREESNPGSASGAPKMDLEYIHKDGSAVWAETTVSLLRDSKGHPFALLGILHDVSERRKTEEALRKSEERFRALIENASDAIIVLSAKGEIVYESPNSQRAVEQKVSSLLGPQLMQVIHPDDVKKVLDLFEWMKDRPGKSVEAEVRFKHKDGSWHTIEGNARNLLRDPRVNGIVINYRNTTEKRRAEEALRDSETKYRRLFESTQTAIEVISMETGCVVLANEAAARMWGFASAHDVIGLDPMDFLQLEDRGWVARRMAETLSAQRLGEAMELRVQASDGRWVWVSAMAAPTEYQGKPALLVSLLDITRRREVEDTLRASEEKYRLLAENVADVIFVLDMNLKPTFFSPSVARISGYSVEEVASDPLETRMTARSLELAMRSLDDALAQERRQPGSVTQQSLDLELRHKDGSIRLADVTASFLRDSEGKPAGIVGVLHDITERRRAEEALRDSERRYRLLAENLSDVIWVINTDLQFTYVSPSVERLLGYSAEEAVALPAQQFVTPASFEAAMGVMAAEERLEQSETSDRERSVTLELELPRKDGSTVWTENRVSYLRDSSGNVTGYLGVSRDVSERRKAQVALRASEERFRTIFEQSPIGAIVYDSDGVTVGANKACLGVFGLSDVADMRGPTLFDDPNLSDRARQKLRMGKSVVGEGSLNLDKARATGLYNNLRSGIIHLRLTVTPLGTNREGVSGGYLALVEDITESRKAQEDLQASEERFRTIFEQSPIGAIVFDAVGVALSANKACMDMFGLSGEGDLKGPKLLSDPTLGDGAKRRLAAGKSISAETEINLDEARRLYSYRYGRSGKIFVHLTVTPLSASKKGERGGYLALVEDITERKKAEEALRASEERFRGLVETTSDWVWEVDAKGVYTYASPRVKKVLGYDSKELVGKTPFDFMPQREAHRVAAVFNGFAAKREPFAFLENVNRHKNGRPVVMETSGVPFFAPDGTLLGYRGVDRDITERKQVGRQLQQSLRRLERTMEAIIQAISATIETRDPYTAGHQRRVTQLACIIARDMNLPGTQIAGIRFAGLLHDIGKICVPTEILNKPGQLSDVEMALIRAHPKLGYGILKGIEFEWPVADIVVQHHERLDGSGYPSGIKGDEILLEARILAVADVVEAMSSHRPYRPAVGVEKALAEITRGKGTLYDPIVVQVCLEIFNKKGFQFEAF